MKGVKYVGPIWDYSGYGAASRSYVLALHKAGVPISVHPHCFDNGAPNVASMEEKAILDSLVGRDVPFDVGIVHLTPDLLTSYAKAFEGKYVINYTVWETSKLHPLWVAACNTANEVWVPCQWNVDSFKSSGVTVPIYKVPHGIDTKMFDGVDPNLLDSFGDRNTFNFYSVFQWNARKNPEGLLRAYFNAFQGIDDVRLILKTYISNRLPPHEEIRTIKEAVARVKGDMRLPHFPKVSLITAALSAEQVKALHLMGDAYAALPCGEGWGLGFMEAGLAGKPVIGTGAGGNMEFMNEENSYPTKFMETYVGGMGTFNQWYLGDQRWFHPSSVDAAEKMRYVYDNRQEAAAVGKKLQQRITQEYSWEKVAGVMINRLREI